MGALGTAVLLRTRWLRGARAVRTVGWVKNFRKLAVASIVLAMANNAVVPRQAPREETVTYSPQLLLELKQIQRLLSGVITL